MRFIKIIVVSTFAIFLANVLASSEIDFSVNTIILEDNISSCNDSIRKAKQENINKLKQKPIEEYIVRLSGTFMTKYVDYSTSRTCSIGLLDNAILILESYLKSSSEPEHVKYYLAEAKLMRASFLPEGTRDTYYRDADALIQQYIKESSVDPYEMNTTPYYLASYSYIKAAKLTNDDEKVILLDKAIAIVQKGRNTEINESIKRQLTEQLDIAFRNKVKYYKGKDEKQFRKVIGESMQFFMENFLSGENHAAYNLAVNYSLLKDAENAKKWLLIIEEKKAADKQICLKELLYDSDLTWLKTNQKEWFTTYFSRNCLLFLQTQLKSTP